MERDESYERENIVELFFFFFEKKRSSLLTLGCPRADRWLNANTGKICNARIYRRLRTKAADSI